MEVKFSATQEVQVLEVGGQYMGKGGDDVVEHRAHCRRNNGINVYRNNALKAVTVEGAQP